MSKHEEYLQEAHDESRCALADRVEDKDIPKLIRDLTNLRVYGTRVLMGILGF